MRNKVLLFGAGATLSLIACLVAPDEPSSTSSAGLSCGTDERAFNGACREVCASSSDCGSNTKCMNVGADTALCIDYAHCAFLGSDTTCSGVATSAYGYGYETEDLTPYGHDYSGIGCTGNATWQVIEPVGDPACGSPHAVTRCASVDGTCRLVAGSTTDIADP